MSADAVLVAATQPREIQVPGEVALRALCWGTLELPYSDKEVGSIVLIHGLGDGADVWRPMMREWTIRRPDLPVIAFDLPGHGGSAWLTEGSYHPEILAGIITAALHRIGISRPTLIGHSIGAQVALMVAKQLPKLSGLVLVEMNPDGGRAADPIIKSHIEALITGADKQRGCVDLLIKRLPLANHKAIEEFVSAAVVYTGTKWYFPRDLSMLALLGATSSPTVWSDLAQVNVPVGIIRGAYSSVLNSSTALRMAASTRIPSRIETIINAGHAIPLEQPADLALKVGTFVESILNRSAYIDTRYLTSS